MKTKGAPNRNVRLSSLSAISLIAIAGVLLTGCAAPGEPTARHSAVPKAITDLHASQRGDSFLLSFNLPSKTTTQKTLRSTPSISIYRSYEGSVANGEAMSHPELMVEIPSPMVTKYLQRGKLRFAMDLPHDQIRQHRGQQILWMVRTEVKADRQSEDSNVVALPVLVAFPGLQDVKATLTPEAVNISWTDLAEVNPASTNSGKAEEPSPEISLKSTMYRIYRAEPATASTTAHPAEEGKTGVGAGTEAQQASGATASGTALEERPGTPAFQLIGEAPRSPYRDSHFEFGHHYIYSVRSVAQYSSGSVESDDSNPATIETRDVFVPTPPTGLVAIPVEASNDVAVHIELSWAISPETDLQGYNVYRSDQEGNSTLKLNDKLLLTPTYRDMSVSPARSYSYSVTAVDRAANESSRSEPVSVRLPADAQDKNK